MSGYEIWDLPHDGQQLPLGISAANSYPTSHFIEHRLVSHTEWAEEALCKLFWNVLLRFTSLQLWFRFDVVKHSDKMCFETLILTQSECLLWGSFSTDIQLDFFPPIQNWMMKFYNVGGSIMLLTPAPTFKETFLPGHGDWIWSSQYDFQIYSFIIILRCIHLSYWLEFSLYLCPKCCFMKVELELVFVIWRIIMNL